MSKCNVSGNIQNQPHNQFGNRIGIGPRSVQNHNTARFCRLQINGITSDSMFSNDLQVFASIHDSSIHGEGSQNNRINFIRVIEIVNYCTDCFQRFSCIRMNVFRKKDCHFFPPCCSLFYDSIINAVNTTCKYKCSSYYYKI